MPEPKPFHIDLDNATVKVVPLDGSGDEGMKVAVNDIDSLPEPLRQAANQGMDVFEHALESTNVVDIAGRRAATRRTPPEMVMLACASGHLYEGLPGMAGRKCGRVEKDPQREGEDGEPCENPLMISQESPHA